MRLHTRAASTVVAVLAAAVLGLAVVPAQARTATPASAATTGATPSAAALHLGPALIDVSVATVWRHATSPRVVDHPALANPVRIRTWLSAMTNAQRRGLDGRADTQVLLGDQVRVIALSGNWARVVVPGQPTPLDPRGYPGWIPKRQLVNGSESTTGTHVMVVKPTTWLRTLSGARRLEVSMGTRLPAVARSGAYWKVRLPDGTTLKVAVSAVVRQPLTASGSSLVRTAKKFLGLAYLWSGTSGFGPDCSGLTELVYRVHGIRIPRDSSAQATAGVAVRRASLRPGDLVFFASSGTTVDHVGMYVGNGLMIHAPHTGTHVQISPLSAAPWSREYVGARRILPT
ncbi:MAG TPA: C40 family peptidase [Actinomycetes bacterium]|nr:C40 family peptidase [Actinomycetes bacterium]